MKKTITVDGRKYVLASRADKPQKSKNSGKKIEFSKIVVGISWGASLLWITFSFFLSWYGRDPNSTVTVTIVTETLATTLGYFGYQGFLKHSRNKNGIGESGVPYALNGVPARPRLPRGVKTTAPYALNTTPEPPEEAAP
jgi:hypothetical protein